MNESAPSPSTRPIWHARHPSTVTQRLPASSRLGDTGFQQYRWRPPVPRRSRPAGQATRSQPISPEVSDANTLHWTHRHARDTSYISTPTPTSAPVPVFFCVPVSVPPLEGRGRFFRMHSHVQPFVNVWKHFDGTKKWVICARRRDSNNPIIKLVHSPAFSWH